jgi:ADP-ribosylglycohydrolase
MNYMKNNILILLIAFFALTSCKEKLREKTQFSKLNKAELSLSKSELQDRIKGAWAAQVIGVTFGLPAEFNYNSTHISDYQPLEWTADQMKNEFDIRPGTYDDIYMDLSFMEVIEKEGIDAPAQSFANSFANRDYKLWFANQTARYNIRNGLTPPESGHWLNNPCADDIDFQIEADFIGLMSPGMVNSAAELCDKVGHIMNYGDGYYGGLFVASLYSLALVADDASDIPSIVETAINVIPPESNFAKCVKDVIQWHKQYPDDWQMAWFKTFQKWGMDVGSPLGVFEPFNIDAKINSAWVVVGLLYGEGDFTRTFEIATRCGDDADCNPATAGGVLAAIVGYDKIPDFWKQGLSDVKDIPFMGTTITLSDAYDMSYKHALQMIEKSGGSATEDEVSIKVQQPITVPLEVSFEGHYPVKKVTPTRKGREISFEFEGIGFALASPPNLFDHEGKNPVFTAELYLNGELIETAKLPTKRDDRRFTPFYKYQLPRGKYKVLIKEIEYEDYAHIQYQYAVIYDNKPYDVNEDRLKK